MVDKTNTERNKKSSFDINQKVSKLEADSKKATADMAKLAQKIETIQAKSMFLGTQPPEEKDRPWLNTESGHVFGFDPMRNEWVSVTTEMIYSSILELKDVRRIAFAMNSGHPVPYDSIIVGMSVAAAKIKVDEMRSLTGGRPERTNGVLQVQFYIDEIKQCYDIILKDGCSTDMTLNIPLKAGALINSISIASTGTSNNEKWSMDRVVFYVKWLGSAKTISGGWVKGDCITDVATVDLSKIKTAQEKLTQASTTETSA